MEITERTIRFGRRVAVLDYEVKDEVLLMAKRDVDAAISERVGVRHFEALYRFYKHPKLHNEVYLPKEHSFVTCEAYVNILPRQSTLHP